jgi:hypothetical protein
MGTSVPLMTVTQEVDPVKEDMKQTQGDESKAANSQQSSRQIDRRIFDVNLRICSSATRRLSDEHAGEK